MGTVLGDLSRLGYDASWHCFGAFEVGAPHLRRRVWIVAWPAPRPLPDPFGEPIRLEWQRLREQRRESGETEPRSDGEDMADGDGQRSERTPLRVTSARSRRDQPSRRGKSMADRDVRGLEAFGLESTKRGRVESLGDFVDRRDLPTWPPAPDDLQAWRRVSAEAQPAFCSLADELPAELVRWRDGEFAAPALRAVGNAVVPACAELVARAINRSLALDSVG